MENSTDSWNSDWNFIMRSSKCLPDSSPQTDISTQQSASTQHCLILLAALPCGHPPSPERHRLLSYLEAQPKTGFSAGLKVPPSLKAMEKQLMKALIAPKMRET